MGEMGEEADREEAEREISFTMENWLLKTIHTSNHFHQTVQPFLQSSFIFRQSSFSFVHAQLYSADAFSATNWGAVTRNIVKPEAEPKFLCQ